MRLLLDTHVAIWAITDDARLSPPARHLIEDVNNDIFVSAASVWEIAIKYALGRGHAGDMRVSGEAALRYFAAAGYAMLAISPLHAAAVEVLPALHADPFDRLLLAQAFCEMLRLLTGDEKVLAYGGTTIGI